MPNPPSMNTLTQPAQKPKGLMGQFAADHRFAAELMSGKDPWAMQRPARPTPGPSRFKRNNRPTGGVSFDMGGLTDFLPAMASAPMGAQSPPYGNVPQGAFGTPIPGTGIIPTMHSGDSAEVFPQGSPTSPQMPGPSRLAGVIPQQAQYQPPQYQGPGLPPGRPPAPPQTMYSGDSAEVFPTGPQSNQQSPVPGMGMGMMDFANQVGMIPSAQARSQFDRGVMFGPDGNQPPPGIFPGRHNASPETQQEFDAEVAAGRAEGLAAMRSQGGIPFAERFPGMTPSEAIGGGNPYGVGSPGFSRAGQMGPVGHGFASAAPHIPDMAPGRWSPGLTSQVEAQREARRAEEGRQAFAGGADDRAQRGAAARQRISDFARLRQQDPESADQQVAARSEAGDDNLARSWANSRRMGNIDPMARSIFNQMAGNDPGAIDAPTASQMPMVREALRAARQFKKGESLRNRQEAAGVKASDRELRLGQRQPTIQEMAQAGNPNAIMQLGQEAQNQLEIQKMNLLENQDQRNRDSGLMSDFMRAASQIPNMTVEQFQEIMQNPPGMLMGGMGPQQQQQPQEPEPPPARKTSLPKEIDFMLGLKDRFPPIKDMNPEQAREFMNMHRRQERVKQSSSRPYGIQGM